MSTWMLWHVKRLLGLTEKRIRNGFSNSFISKQQEQQPRQCALANYASGPDAEMLRQLQIPCPNQVAQWYFGIISEASETKIRHILDIMLIRYKENHVVVAECIEKLWGFVANTCKSPRSAFLLREAYCSQQASEIELRA